MSHRLCFAIVIGTGATLFQATDFITYLTAAGLTNLKEADLLSDGQKNPFGKPDCSMVRYECDQGSIVIVHRHGALHGKPPSALNFRAMFYALKLEGVTHYWATTACGSLNKLVSPGSLVLTNQFIDFTGQRNSFFSKKGPAIHLPMADPTCLPQDAYLAEIAAKLGIGVIHDPDELLTALCIAGPEFGTRAESRAWQRLGADLVAMTMAREAKLARACGFHGSWLHLVSDFDAWKRYLAGVSTDEVEAALPEMVEGAAQIFRTALVWALLNPERLCWSCLCRDPLPGHGQGDLSEDRSWFEIIGQR